MMKTVQVSLTFTPELLDVLRNHPSTKVDDLDEWHRRIGWLVCVWDVIVEHQAAAASAAPTDASGGQ